MANPFAFSVMPKRGLRQQPEENRWDAYQALYIHIPFCKKRCLYCDFTTQAIDADSPRMDEYTEALVGEIRHASKAGLLGSVKTVYLGGGTPTYLGNKRLSQLLYALSLSMHLTPEVECTLEANPESLTQAMVKDLWALGVTRLSIGVQSFDDELLQMLGRVHTAKAARRAIEIASLRFENISIDLMCGLPGQTEAQVANSIAEALSLGVKHISIYPLAIEQGTPFSRMVAAGHLAFDEDAGAEHMRLAAELLQAAGMQRYEVASYAYPGYESCHNSAYWQGIPYLGLGQGAVTMRQTAGCRQRLEGSTIIEELNASQIAAEDAMLAMRMMKGLSSQRFEALVAVLPQARETFTQLEQDGYIRFTGSAYVPTEQGWLFGNQLYGRILDLAP